MFWGDYHRRLVLILIFCQQGKLHRKGNKWIYSGTLIFLWIFVTVEFASDWFITRQGFAVENSSPLAIFQGMTANALWSTIQNIAWTIYVSIADAIIVRIILWQ